MSKKSFAVIGLGEFGSAIVEELVNNGRDVIAIDSDKEAIDKVSKFLPTCFIADSSDEKALKELRIQDVDTAIVAYGSNVKGSILTTAILREVGVKNIIVRVDNEYYIPIFKKLGATEIVTPQKSAGIALAKRLGTNDFKDYHPLDDKYSVVSIKVSEKYPGKTLIDLNAKNVYGVNLVLINRNNKSFTPGGKDSLLANDIVYVVGTAKEIVVFREALNGKDK